MRENRGRGRLGREKEEEIGERERKRGDTTAMPSAREKEARERR